MEGDGVSQDYSVANTLGSPAQTDGDLVIGSQLLEERGSKGYYGFVGLINGVKVADGAKTATEVQSDYDTYESLTAAWN